MRLKVLIDSSNLVGGGGTQVASAFIETVDRALASTPDKLPSWVAEADWYVSESVRDALAPLHRIRPILTARRWRLQTLRRPPYDAIFTIFGPAYRLRRAPIEVMGYDDGRIIVGDDVCMDTGARLHVVFGSRTWNPCRPDAASGRRSPGCPPGTPTG